MAQDARAIKRTDASSGFTIDDEIRVIGCAVDVLIALLKAINKNGGDADSIKRLLSEPNLADACGRLIAGTQSDEPARETVKIPDKSVEYILKWIRRECTKQGISADFLDRDLPRWKYLLKKARGKEFAVIVHSFGRNWNRSDAKGFHKARKIDGNSVAFVFWVLTKKPIGCFSTVADDDTDLFHRGDRLFAPHVDGDDVKRLLILGIIHAGWGAHVSLVAFSEVSSS